jgi:hypothetical protein
MEHMEYVVDFLLKLLKIMEFISVDFQKQKIIIIVENGKYQTNQNKHQFLGVI